MRFHLVMLLIVILVSLGMHGLATAAPSQPIGAARQGATTAHGEPSEIGRMGARAAAAGRVGG